MVVGRTVQVLVPRRVRAVPADLAVMCVAVVLVNGAVFLPIVRETPLRIPLGLALVLFVPGYVVIAAAYPERSTSQAGAEAATESDSSAEVLATRSRRAGVDAIERVVLSVGASVVIVPVLGLGLNATPWGIEPVPVIVSVSAFSLLGAAVATARRWRVPAADRFRVPYREWLGAARSGLLEPDTRTDAALNLVLVVSIVLALGSVGYAAAVLPQDDEYSALSVLTADDDELAATDYPTTFEEDTDESVIVGVDNREGRTVDYTIVVLEETFETDGNETVLTNRTELDRVETTLEDGESDRIEYEPSPTMTGEDGRLVWLLYLDEPPPDPSAENAPYDTYLVIDGDEDA